MSIATFGNYYVYDAIGPLAEQLSAERLGTAYGLLFMMQAVGLTIVNMDAGKLNDVFGAGADNPAGYTPMLIMFAVLAASALIFSIALWRRESGPHGHGMELPG